MKLRLFIFVQSYAAKAYSPNRLRAKCVNLTWITKTNAHLKCYVSTAVSEKQSYSLVSFSQNAKHFYERSLPITNVSVVQGYSYTHILAAVASIPMGQGDMFLPIFTLGGTSISMPPQCLRTSILKQHALLASS